MTDGQDVIVGKESAKTDSIELSKVHDPLVDQLEEIDDILWRASKYMNDATDWWDAHGGVPFIAGVRDKIMEILKRTYDAGWHDCADRAIKICQRRDDASDKSFEACDEAAMCAEDIQTYCVTEMGSWNDANDT